MRKKNANKSEVWCYYCKKIGRTMWNYKNCVSDLLKGKLKELVNIDTNEYTLNSNDVEFNEGIEPLSPF